MRLFPTAVDRPSGRSRGVVWTRGRARSAALLLALPATVITTGLSFAVAGAVSAASPVTRAATVAASSSSRGWEGARWGDQTADLQAADANGYDAKRDPGSLYTVTKSIGARRVWDRFDSQGRRITGQGVTVALLDTGAQPVAGLSAPDKLVYGPDLSLERGDPNLIDQDDYGHGTHLAGIIGAHDSGVTPGRNADPSAQLGVAPDATIMPLKLSTADGATDVSQVIAALDWVVTHRNDDPSRPVRVINLAYGTTSTQDYRSDPLAAAAENAWRHGIVVVTSAGNGGSSAGRLTDPAIDPYVIAVGASDSQDRTDDKRLIPADFNSVGSADRHVDLLARGTSIASLRDPGSYIDVNHPEGLVSTDPTGRLFRGSGTSQAAAVVSGAVALLLQDHPELSPDQVKGLLTANADALSGDPNAVGAGEIDIDATVTALDNPSYASRVLRLVPGLRTVQDYPVSSGLGSLEQARGGAYVYDPDSGEPLTGEQDVQGIPWDPAAWSVASTAGVAWVGGSWLGTVWAGDSWTYANGVLAYANADWSGARWSGARWSGARWSGARWSGARWSDADWSGARWSGARWSGARWSGARWSADVWGAET